MNRQETLDRYRVGAHNFDGVDLSEDGDEEMKACIFLLNN